MSRVVKITKVNKSTIVELSTTGNPVTQTIVFNKNTNLYVENGVCSIFYESNICPVILFKLDELENNLGATTIEGYVAAAAAANLFVN